MTSNSLDVAYKPSWLSMVAAMESQLSFMGKEADYDWIAGITGFAFRNAVEDQLLPGAFNFNFIWFDTFLSAYDRLGVCVEIISCHEHQLTFDAHQELLWEKICQSVENNLPPMVWENFEFGVVTGFDRELANWECAGVQGKLIHPRAKLGLGDVPFLFGAIPVKNVQFDKTKATTMALRVAVSVGFLSKPPYPTGYNAVIGVEAYRKWQQELEKDFNLYGCSHLIQTLKDARGSASLFLAKVSELYDGVTSTLLMRASERFAQVQHKLGEMSLLFPYPGEFRAGEIERSKGKEMLEDCYIMETEGLKLIATAIERLDAK